MNDNGQLAGRQDTRIGHLPGQEGIGGWIPDVLVNAIPHAIEFAEMRSNGRVPAHLHVSHVCVCVRVCVCVHETTNRAQGG